MKKRNTIITAIFFLMAVALGWFLPLAAFTVEDSIADGRRNELSIEHINLSYRDDLSMSQKINLVYYINTSELIALDKGIYNQSNDINRIMNEFMADFTGFRHSVDYALNARPMLLNLSNNKGTIVIWEVDAYIYDNWHFSCFIDDKTGAILRVFLEGDPTTWNQLLSYVEDGEDESIPIAERFGNALLNHYSRQLSAKFVNYKRVDDLDMYPVSYRLVFRDEKNYVFQILVNVDYYSGFLETS